MVLISIIRKVNSLIPKGDNRCLDGLPTILISYSSGSNSFGMRKGYRRLLISDNII